eukprot:CAMPEP_0176248286 /NCGR_PEP_ID=MMETSP0121_2-20121125/33390_1 /TAXON_ID=160619 /ORGANISM="Kryptoperidinium foliaceum, Strain CCMP 1326" /LENGTH=71 /DNA_ID=CAMNT_0017587963 /DNA_START=129 /DNA_END=344 /DNA_ORIENTATION=-
MPAPSTSNQAYTTCMIGSLILPASDLQELSNIRPEVTFSKKRRTTRIGEFLPDNPEDPKAHPYHVSRKGTK